MDRLSSEILKQIASKLRVVAVEHAGSISSPDECIFNYSCTTCRFKKEREVYDEKNDVFLVYQTASCLEEGMKVFKAIEAGVPKELALKCSFLKAKVDENNADAINALKNYVDGNVLIFGEPDDLNPHAVGVGKTFLLISLLKELSQIKKVRFLRSVDMKSTTLTDEEMVFIDDLGKEAVDDFAIKKVFDVVDACYTRGIRLAITTNFNLNELEQIYKNYGPAIVSRLLEKAIIVSLKGPDRRLMTR